MSTVRHEGDPGAGVPARVPQIVIVAASCDRFADFVRAAQAGEIGLHFCINGHSAMRLARRFAADAWIVAADLPEMSGCDLVDMLSARVLQGDVDPPRFGARSSLDRAGESLHAAIFIVSDDYRIEDEHRALAAGIAGFIVHPVTLDVIRDSLQHAATPARERVTTASGAS
jgi:CheY-like chemotaxis protein